MEHRDGILAKLGTVRRNAAGDPFGLASDPTMQLGTLEAAWRFYERKVGSDDEGRALESWANALVAVFALGAVEIVDLHAHLHDVSGRLSTPEVLVGLRISEQIVRFLYTNWRGVTGRRRVIPRAVAFGPTDWHPEPQWLLHAYDLERDADRSFAIRDIRDWRDEDRP